jgi:hypothetical protein
MASLVYSGRQMIPDRPQISRIATMSETTSASSRAQRNRVRLGAIIADRNSKSKTVWRAA